MKGKILVIEDDKSLRVALGDTLNLFKLPHILCADAESAISLISSENIVLVLTDINLPGISGHDFLKIVKKRNPLIPVILLTAFGDVSGAVAAIQNGAADYLLKPFAPEFLIDKIKKFVTNVESEENEFPVAKDPTTKQLFDLALKVAKSNATVLITGESGSGKEVLAKYIHENSPRKNNPFVAINCAAIPDNMLEAVLFGYEKGAFTGAYQAQAGKFELAQKGTLLLDEISEMSLTLQAKLLRVLQEREVERLGGKKLLKLDVRVIATSNRNLKFYVQNNHFREDLYYRLNVFPLHWKPLRERPLDILPLAEYLLKLHSEKNSCSIVPQLNEEAKNLFLDYPWPGNVREMDNVIQRALILKKDHQIEVEDLQLEYEQKKAKKSVKTGGRHERQSSESF